jgi:Fe-Mn family superoxide dismutase
MFVRNKLNYELFDLRPFIDFETMDEHYNVHYKKYTENMNKAIIEYNIIIDPSAPLNSLIGQLKNFDKYPVDFRNNAGGYINHMIYFENISPVNNDYESYASDELKNMIDMSFGGYDNFVQSFKNAGKNVFGSGWVWLVSNGNRLAILTTANQDNPLMSIDTNILLGMDVWEHAYYLKHKADRASYIDDFLRVVDWSVVSKQLV